MSDSSFSRNSAQTQRLLCTSHSRTIEQSGLCSKFWPLPSVKPMAKQARPRSPRLRASGVNSKDYTRREACCIFIPGCMLYYSVHDVLIALKRRSQVCDLSQVEHPNVVRYIEYGLIDGYRPYMILEAISGSDVQRILDKKKVKASLPGTLPCFRVILTS